MLKPWSYKYLHTLQLINTKSLKYNVEVSLALYCVMSWYSYKYCSSISDLFLMFLESSTTESFQIGPGKLSDVKSYA